MSHRPQMMVCCIGFLSLRGKLFFILCHLYHESTRHLAWWSHGQQGQDMPYRNSQYDQRQYYDSGNLEQFFHFHG